MSPHDFMDEEWSQDDQDSPKAHRPRRHPARRRRVPGGLIVAAVVVLLLIAAGVVLLHPREVTRTPIVTSTPEAAAPVGASDSTTSAPAAASEEDAPPAAPPTVEQTIARWATRESPEDQSWQSELTADIAPDAARRIAVMPCLPVQAAPLRVDSLAPVGEPAQSGSAFSGDYTVTVSDATGAQTPVVVRVAAAWNTATDTWMVTSLECLASGGGE